MARSRTFIFDIISVFFCINGIFCTLSGNLEHTVSISPAKYLKKMSQSDFTDVNSDRAGGRIRCGMVILEFHRRRRLTEFSEIT